MWKFVSRRCLERPGRRSRQGLDPQQRGCRGRRPNDRNGTRRHGSRGRGKRRGGGGHIDREDGDDDNDDSELESESESELESESESDDNGNSNDANPDDLTGKYENEGKRKGKGGRRRYRDDNEINALHGLYKPKDDDGECGYHDDDSEDMEEK